MRQRGPRSSAPAVAGRTCIAGPQLSSPLTLFEVRQYGGALLRSATAPDFVTGRTAGFGVWISALDSDSADAAGNVQAVRSALDALLPWSTGTAQANFVGGVNEPAEAVGGWTVEQHERIDQIRDRYDQRGVFRRDLDTSPGH